MKSPKLTTTLETLFGTQLLDKTITGLGAQAVGMTTIIGLIHLVEHLEKLVCTSEITSTDLPFLEWREMG